jgi:hypothetical protein
MKYIWMAVLALCFATGLTYLANSPEPRAQHHPESAGMASIRLIAPSSFVTARHEDSIPAKSNWHPGKSGSHKFRPGRSSEPGKWILSLPSPRERELGPITAASDGQPHALYLSPSGSAIASRAPPSFFSIS